MTRDDVEEVNNTCELMENFLPRRGGWMQYRPGTQALGACKTNAAHRIIPFVDDGDVPTLLEFSQSDANPSVETVRIWSNDALLEVTATVDNINNDEFATDLAGWTQDDTGTGNSQWSSDFSGSMQLTGGPSAGDSASRSTNVTTTVGERTIEIFIRQSQLLFQIGTGGARSNDIFEGLLSPGYHMITFVADGSSTTYTFTNTNPYHGYVEYCRYKATGTFELTAPFFTDTSTLGTVLETVRYTQINDVLFLTSAGYYQEGFAWPLIVVRRWATKSWSFEIPEILDGPFGALNDGPITLTPSVRNGNGTLTASNNFFTDPGHVGRKYKLVHGETEGICEVLEVTSATVADIRVLRSFGGTTATRDWFEGRLAYYLPSPTSVDVYQNRLWLAGGARIYGSVSDLFLSFDETIEGDSAAIQKTIALGPVQEISWLAGGDELFIGLTAEEMRVTSTADYEAVTQNNITLRRGTNRGSKAVQSVIVNGLIYFIQRSGKKLLSLTGLRGEEAVTQDTTVLHPSITGAGIKRIAYTAEPEPRMYVLLEDGTMRCMLFDNVENITAWSRITIGGGATVVDLATVPSGGDDQIYVIVDRDGISRSIEHFVDEDTAVGQDDSRHFDSHKYLASPGGTFTGLDHLEGVIVDVWADGQPRGRTQVSGGLIALDESTWTDVVVGVRHTAKWKSNRIARYIDESVFNYRKRISQLGLIAKNLAIRTFKYGPSETDLHNMPDIEDGRPRPPSTDPYPTITDTLLGTLEGPMKTQDVTLYGNYIVAACDSVPTPPASTTNQQIVYHDGDQSAYILGGTAGATSYAEAWRYDPVAEALYQLADMPSAMEKHSTEIDEQLNQIYVLGIPNGGVNFFNRYDIATDAWEDASTLAQPTLTAHSGDAYLCYYDGVIYRFGGDDGAGSSVATFEAYDIATDTWYTPAGIIGTPTAVRLGGYCSPKVGLDVGRLFFWGGYEGSLTDSNLFQRYTIPGAFPVWTTLPSTGSGAARQNVQLASPGDDFLYLWGGKPRVGTTNFDWYVYQFDLLGGTWSFILTSEGPSAVPPTPYARVQHSMYGKYDTNDRFYMHGGSGRNGNLSSNWQDFWEYNTVTDEWNEIASVVSPAAGACRIFDKTDVEVLLSTSAQNLTNTDGSGDDLRGRAVLIDYERDIAFFDCIEDDDATLNRVVVAVDISDPADPVQLGAVEGGTNVTTVNKGLTYDGRYLFVFSFDTNNNYMYIIDTEDPAAMSIEGSVQVVYDTNAVKPQRAFYNDNKVYVMWENDWTVISVANKSNPSIANTQNFASTPFMDETIAIREGNYVLTTGPTHGAVHLWQFTDAVTLEFISYVKDADMVGAVDMNVFWPYAYVAAPTKTTVVDFSNALSPVVVASYQGYTDVTSMVGQSPGLFFSGSTTSSGQIYASDVRSWELIDYDEMSFEFPGTFDTDSRLYFEATGPATILQVSFEIEDVDYPQRGSDGPNQS